MVHIKKYIIFFIFYFHLNFVWSSKDLPLDALSNVDYFNVFNKIYAELSKNQTLQLTVNNNIELKCLQHLNAVRDGLWRQEIWALEVFDAWVKFPTGIYYGNSIDLGNFDECIKIVKNLNETEKFTGKYCLANVKLNLTDNFQQKYIKWGICVPNVCKSQDIENYLQLLINNSDYKMHNFIKELNIDENNCTTAKKDEFQILDWIAIAIFTLIGILMILSTIYDYASARKTTVVNPILASFSITRNLEFLLKIRTKTDGVIACLDGIRSLSIIWIVYGHCHFIHKNSPFINPNDISQWLQTPYSMFLQSFNISVDSFFFLSGLLLALVVFRKMEKNNGALNIPLMYLHRIIRLTPILGITLLFHMTIQRFMGSGPLWNQFQDVRKLCDDKWWATLLYIQNYATNNHMCLGHSWYLAVDMQFYIISPIIFLALWKWKRKALAFLIIIGLLLFICTFTIIVINQINIMDSAASNDLMTKIYYKTHTRASPWIIGILFGYYLRNNNNNNNNNTRVKLSKCKILLGWLLSIAFVLTVIFVLYPFAYNNEKTVPVIAGAFYWTLSRIIWPLALSWIVYACQNGYGGVINKFLSWTFWQPLSKLSYCIYLWHLLIQMINVGQLKTNAHFSNYELILNFWGDFGITMLVSLLMFIAVEAPFSNIESALLAEKKLKDKVAKLSSTMPPTTTTTIVNNLIIST